MSSLIARRIAIGGAAIVALGFAYYEFCRFRPARFLSTAALAVLPSGRSLLVVEEVVGSSLSNDQFLRFEIFDARSGARLHRILPFSVLANERLEFLGGTVRQWWARDSDEVLLLDVETGTVAATADDIVRANPALRGEIHRAGDDLFDVDKTDALIVKGGDGQLYAIAPATLQATALERIPGSLREWWTAPQLPREVEGVPAPNARSGFALVCRTISNGPCSLRYRKNAVTWVVEESGFDGNDPIGVEEWDQQAAYVYVANDSALGMLFGGVWVYALNLGDGGFMWKAKL